MIRSRTARAALFSAAFTAAIVVLDHLATLWRAPGSWSAWYAPAALYLVLPLTLGSPWAALGGVAHVAAKAGRMPLADLLATAVIRAVVVGAASAVFRRWWRGTPRLVTPADGGRLVTAGLALSVTLGTALTGFGAFRGWIAHARFGSALLTFASGDVVAIALFAPLLMLDVAGPVRRWLNGAAGPGDGDAPIVPPPAEPPAPGGWKRREPALQIAAMAGSAALVALAPYTPISLFQFAIVPIMWIALTRGARWTARASAVLGVAAVPALVGHSAAPAEAIPVFLTLVAVVGVILGCATDQRRAAERRLRASEGRFRELAGVVGEVFWLYDGVAGRLEYVSPAFERIWGRPVEEAIGSPRGWIAGVHPDDRAMVEAGLPRHVTDEGEMEYRVLRPDGRVRRVRSRSFPVRGADGRVVRAAGVVDDVTERWHVTELLRQSEAYFRSLIENVSDLLVLMDERGTLSFVSPSARRVLAYEPAVLLGKNGMELVHPEDRPAADESLRELLEEGTQQTMRVRIRDGNGGWRVCETLGGLVAGPERMAVVSIRDVTDRARAEAKYRRLFATSPDGVFAVDGNGVITEANEALGNILGRTPAELAGMHFLDMIDPADHPAAADAFANRAEIGRRTELELTVRRPDGERRRIVSRSAPIEEDGGVVGVHGVVRDVTEHRIVQEQVLRAERISSLATLVSGVAHELNNPLAAVTGFAQLLLLDAGEHDREALEIIHREASRAARIVADLRLFARSAHEPEGAPGEADLNEVVIHVLRVRAYSLQTRNVRVEQRLAPGLPPVSMRRTEMEQVVLNLVVNAEQAMASHPDAPKRLALETSAAHGRVVLRVADTGPGIAADDLAHVFDPFWTTKAPGDGAGLGLSLVHGFVAAAGGSVRAANGDAGAVFTVELPAAAASPAPEPVSAPAAASHGDGLRVLVVDDERPVRGMISTFLRRRGHRVDEAADGSEALERLEGATGETGYDVILSDLRMPGMGGEQLLTALRAAGGGMDRRVVFMTGDTASADTARILDLVQAPVLAKPFGLDELQAVVERFART